MEDSHLIQAELGHQADVHLLAVFDGHRGPQAAQYAAEHIAAVVADRLQQHSTAGALLTSFISLDDSLR